MKKYFIIYILIIFSLKVNASSCCGGGSSSSMIITSDNQKEFSFGIAHRSDIGQTNNSAQSTFNNDQIVDQKQTLSLSAGFLLKDYWQLALKTGIAKKTVHKSGLKETNQGLTEVEAQGTYEYLPEYNYHPYKPRGFIFVKVSIPTSKSIYDSESRILSDVRGSGLYSLTLGNFLFKKTNDFTFKLGLDLTHTFGGNFKSIQLKNYQKFSIPLGISYVVPNSDFSVGATETFNYTLPKTTVALSSNGQNSKSSQEYYWDLNFFVNYSKERDSIWSISYSDSSIIGKSVNSPLYRSIALNYTFVEEI